MFICCSSLSSFYLFFFSFTCGASFISLLRNGLSKFGAPSGMLEFLSQWTYPREDYPKIPEAKGAISAIRSEAFFIPLYELYLTYGGIFRLTFGPKVLFLLSMYFVKS